GEGEPLIEKSTYSAFVGTDLEERLQAAGIDTLVIAGFVTDHCVESTARSAVDLGFSTYLVADATATFERTGPDGRYFDAETMHEAALASMNGGITTIADTETVLSALGAGTLA
ncbi:MAG: cysteine hydrolase family protein, partial [Chloroflexota bacterium]